ncbi:hypothetical protein DPMN_141496 [Dreissena polymorpha]|uniref:Uncharacterized protein n=1 Tax=Dreissena polymorpha TaxID=45954 RepID=A0A9D4GFH2_DREPO|nr:hypothetical protein DPMN_141496 [Dreissena polymorpha]
MTGLNMIVGFPVIAVMCSHASHLGVMRNVSFFSGHYTEQVRFPPGTPTAAQENTCIEIICRIADTHERSKKNEKSGAEGYMYTTNLLSYNYEIAGENTIITDGTA